MRWEVGNTTGQEDVDCNFKFMLREPRRPRETPCMSDAMRCPMLAATPWATPSQPRLYFSTLFLFLFFFFPGLRRFSFFTRFIWVILSLANLFPCRGLSPLRFLSSRFMVYGYFTPFSASFFSYTLKMLGKYERYFIIWKIFKFGAALKGREVVEILHF